MFHRSHGCTPARPPAKIFVRRRRPACSYGFRLKPQPGQNQGAADTGPPAVTGSRSQFFGTFGTFFSGRAKPATATPNRISRGGSMPEKFPASSQYAPRSKGHGAPPRMPLVAAVRLRPGARIQMPLAQIFGPVFSGPSTWRKGTHLKCAPSTPMTASASCRLAGTRGQHERSSMSCRLSEIQRI